jgi:hypothetical protein
LREGSTVVGRRGGLAVEEGSALVEERKKQLAEAEEEKVLERLPVSIHVP